MKDGNSACAAIYCADVCIMAARGYEPFAKSKSSRSIGSL
jgi:hypothetical protein